MSDREDLVLAYRILASHGVVDAYGPVHLGHARRTTPAAKPAALMRGHGAVVVGESLMVAVVRSVYLELSAKLQMQAMLIAGPGGHVVYLDEREVAATSVRQVSAGTWKRTWDLWCIKARAQIEMEQKAKRRRRK